MGFVRVRQVLGAALLAAGLAGCMGGTPEVASIRTPGFNFGWHGPEKKILIVEPNITVDVMMILHREAMAEWTVDGNRNLAAALKRYLGGKGISVVTLEHATDPHDVQLVKLYEVVLANSPVKSTLGPGTQSMRDRFGADYALFVNVHEFAFMQLQGQISLVDLHTGDIVWFGNYTARSNNLDFSHTVPGDLRSETGADEFVANIMKDFPL